MGLLVLFNHSLKMRDKKPNEKANDKILSSLGLNKQYFNRTKELETINEEHRKINGELRKTINEAIEYINKSIDNHTDWYNYIHGDEDGEVYNLDILLNILQGSDE